MSLRHPARLPLLALGMLALLGGLWSGLVRLGWALPMPHPSFSAGHGPLMVCGFLGTLIALERAVALGHRWGYAAPLLTGLGGLSVIAGIPEKIGQLFIAAASLLYLLIFVILVSRRPVVLTAVSGLGAFSWLIGNLLWLGGWPISVVVFWWAGFLLLTITGERVELARLQHLSRFARASVLLAAAILLSGLFLTTSSVGDGVRMTGAGTMALTWWLVNHDIARRTIRQAGLTRFIAACLLSGYVWLGLSGGFMLLMDGVVAGPHYDAVLHTFFLGFVFAMIFGHAPIIFPAVLGSPVAYRPLFYAHLGLLHLTLALRLTGDLTDWLTGRQMGGLLNVVTLLVFVALTVHGILTSPAPKQALAPRASSTVGQQASPPT